MRIKEITGQHRRDFSAVLVCEHCSDEVVLNTGYDDDNYHENVIPKMQCESCGKTADMETYRPLTTKYPAGFVI